MLRVRRARARCAASSSVPSPTRASPCACASEERAGVRRERQVRAAEPALGVRERAVDERPDVLGRERLQHEHAGPRQQGGDHLERRVLRRRADEDHRAALDVRQERVLLRLVEAVNLVDEEQDRLAGATQLVLRVGDDLAQLLHAVQHGRERDVAYAARVGEEPRERGLARSGRAPQDQRLQASAGEQIAQDATRSEEVALADELVHACAAACARRAARARASPPRRTRAGTARAAAAYT